MSCLQPAGHHIFEYRHSTASCCSRFAATTFFQQFAFEHVTSRCGHVLVRWRCASFATMRALQPCAVHPAGYDARTVYHQRCPRDVRVHIRQGVRGTARAHAYTHRHPAASPCTPGGNACAVCCTLQFRGVPETVGALSLRSPGGRGRSGHRRLTSSAARDPSL